MNNLMSCRLNLNKNLHQKQIIVLIRSIRKTPPIIILDGALDVQDDDEKNIENALDRIMEGKASIILSNKLSVRKNIEEILVFHQGKVVERVSYDVLKARQGVFLQAGRKFSIEF